jgi:hypothetical protein
VDLSVSISAPQLVLALPGVQSHYGCHLAAADAEGAVLQPFGVVFGSYDGCHVVCVLSVVVFYDLALNGLRFSAKPGII